jgi:hypothetical protein
MKNKIKIINDNIKQIFAEGKFLNKCYTDFENKIKGITDKSNLINEKRVDLLNNIFKYPKKKILFNYTFEGSNYKIGLNANGLGIAGKWDKNLKNILDYYPKKNFIEMINGQDFKNLLLSNTKKEYKEILPKLFEDENPKISKNLVLKKLTIQIGINHLQIVSNLEPNAFRGIQLLDEQAEKVSTPDYLNDFTEVCFNFEQDKIVNYAYILQFKDEIITALNNEIGYYDEINTYLDTQITEIDKYLNPFEALKNL